MHAQRGESPLWYVPDGGLLARSDRHRLWSLRNQGGNQRFRVNEADHMRFPAVDREEGN